MVSRGRSVSLIVVALLLTLVGQSQTSHKATPTRLKLVEDFRDHWTDQDVRWIITKEELCAFKQLTNDEERYQFIDQFWIRRGPTPPSLENPYKLEHYRRLLYAKQHFGERDTRGWETDRGRVLILWGQPDEVEEVPILVNGISRDSVVWHYRTETKGHPAAGIQFVDTCSCNELSLTSDSLKILTKSREPSQEISNGDHKIQLIIGPNPQPKIQFKDLYEVVAHKVKAKMLPVSFSASSEAITDGTNMASFRIEVRDDAKSAGGTASPVDSIRYFGQVTSITGRVVQLFEGRGSCAVDSATGKTLCIAERQIPLPKGMYRLELAVSDEAGTRFGTIAQIN